MTQVRFEIGTTKEKAYASSWPWQEVTPRPAGAKVIVHDATNLTHTTFEVHYHAPAYLSYPEAERLTTKFYHCEKFKGVSDFLDHFDYMNDLQIFLDHKEARKHCEEMGYQRPNPIRRAKENIIEPAWWMNE